MLKIVYRNLQFQIPSSPFGKNQLFKFRKRANGVGAMNNFFVVLSSCLFCTAFAKYFARALDGFSFIQSNISAERVFAGIRTRGCWVRSANATSVLFSPPSYEERM